MLGPLTNSNMMHKEDWDEFPEGFDPEKIP
jgi:hypothetical protein